MKWHELTKDEQLNFIEWCDIEYTEGNGYTTEEIEQHKEDIPKNLYYIEDGLTYQF